MKESQEQFKNIFESSNDPIVYFDRLGNVIDLNEKAVQIYGSPKKEIIGKHFKKTGVFSLKDIPVLLGAFANILAGKKGTADVFIKNKKGQEVFLECTANLVKVGKETRVLLVGKDTTECRKTEKKLQKSEEKYKIISESSHDFITLHSGKELICTYANPATLKTLGYSKKEFIGKSAIGFIHPDDRAIILKSFEESIKTGKGFNEFRFRKKDGFYVWLEGTGRFMQDERGEILAVVICRNITERKEAEKALRKSEERLSRFLDASMDIMSIWDSKLNLIELNKLGVDFFSPLKKEDLIGKNMAELIPNVKEIGRYDKYMQVIKTGKPFFVDDAVSHPKFGLKYFSAKAFKVGDGMGLVSTEITERKKTEAEKAKLRKKLEEYAKKLEIKVEKLEKKKIGLTEKEKLILYSLTELPALNDRKLSKITNINRSTVTAIRNRLVAENFFRTVNFPNLRFLGSGLLTLFYAQFDTILKKRDNEEILSKINDIPEIVYATSTENSKFVFLFTKNFLEYRKIIDEVFYSCKKNGIKLDAKTFHFPLGIEAINCYINYSQLIKNLFKINLHFNKTTKLDLFDGGNAGRLKKNEKKILYALIKYPESSNTEISKIAGMTRATVAKTKERLIKKKLFITKIIPNLHLLGFELGVFSYANFESSVNFDLTLHTFNKKGLPPFVFFMQGGHEAIGINVFENHSEFERLKAKAPFKDKTIFVEEPTLMKFPLPDVRHLKLDFALLTKKLLDLDADF